MNAHRTLTSLYFMALAIFVTQLASIEGRCAGECEIEEQIAGRVAEDEAITNALLYVRQLAAVDNEEDRQECMGTLLPYTWVDFFSVRGQETRLPGLKLAFDRFLACSSTCDMRTVNSEQRDLLLVALSQCEVLNHTNCVPYMLTWAMNDKGIYRDMAASLAIKYSAVEDSTTSFVENVMTNVANCPMALRFAVVKGYVERLEGYSCTNGAHLRALAMLYSNRECDACSRIRLDRLLATKMPGYLNSSNRLESSIQMLSFTNSHPQFISYFVGVTNQLLSSGRPLRWIEVGGEGR